MKKSYIWALSLLLVIGFSSCSNPFSKPLSFEESYEALVGSNSMESILSTLGNLTTTEQEVKVDATYKSDFWSGTVALNFLGKGTTGSGMLENKSEGSLDFSGDVNAPIMGEAQENIKAGGKIDFKMTGGKLYVRTNDLKASSPNTKLSDQIGAGVGMVNGTLGGKWIAIDLVKYQAMLGSGAASMDNPGVKDLYELQQTAAGLLKKYPFLKNNGEITEGGVKWFAVSLNNDNILTAYAELIKNPTMIKLMKNPSEEDMRNMKADLEKSLKEIQFSGKLLPRGANDVTLAITSLQVSGKEVANGSVSKKDGTTTMELTMTSSVPNTSGSGETQGKVTVDLTCTKEHMTGKIDVLENNILQASIHGDIQSKLTKDGMNITGDITANGNIAGTKGDIKANELRVKFSQNIKKIPSFEVSIPDGSRTIEDIMQSFGLGGASDQPSMDEEGILPNEENPNIRGEM